MSILKELIKEIKDHLFVTFHFWDIIKDDSQWKPECAIETRFSITLMVLAEFYLGLTCLIIAMAMIPILVMALQ